MLAAATYLDPAYTDRVIDELLANEQRAVVPSFFGLDLGPIARHAVNAKRLNLIRDAVLTLVFLICLFLTPYGTTVWTIIGVGCSILFGRPRRSAKRTAHGSSVWKILLILLVLVIIIGVFIGVQKTRNNDVYDDSSGTGLSGLTGLLHTAHTLTNIVVFPLAIYATLIFFEVQRYRLLTGGFRYGDRHTAPLVRNTRVHQRIEEIERAQYGNVTMYNCWSPFVGAGTITRSWSITLDLVNVDVITQKRTPVQISAVDLHEAVRKRVVGLRDDPQRDNERVTGLLVQHHIVASGARDVEHPLIDEARRKPYALALPETIEALIGHPQAGARYYQRVTVTADGTPVHNRHGVQIAEAEDQEIGVSAFVYFAVEGGMLYVEFVLTVMPPIRTDFHLIDALPRTIRPNWIPKIIRSAATDLLAVALPAPVRLIPGLFFNVVLTGQMREARQEADEFLIYDYGARRSIRELGAEPDVTTYMQKLDAEKYGKLIERRVNEAVLDFLIENNVDVAEYRQRINLVQNTGVIITGGDISGQIVNASMAASITQTNPGPAKATT